jgi:hypothetical protein
MIALALVALTLFLMAPMAMANNNGDSSAGAAPASAGSSPCASASGQASATTSSPSASASSSPAAAETSSALPETGGMNVLPLAALMLVAAGGMTAYNFAHRR